MRDSNITHRYLKPKLEQFLQLFSARRNIIFIRMVLIENLKFYHHREPNLRYCSILKSNSSPDRN